MAGPGRTLDRKLAVDWTEPPGSTLDVEVVIVYEDGTRERVADEHLSIAPDGVLVEGHPLAPGRRVAQAEVEWNETTGPVERLVGWLSGVPDAVREFPDG